MTESHEELSLFAALLLAIVGQILLDLRLVPVLAIVPYAMAAVLFVRTVGQPSHGFRRYSQGVRSGSFPFRMLVVVAAVGPLAFAYFGGNAFTVKNTALWGGGLLLLGRFAGPSSDSLTRKPAKGQGCCAHGLCIKWYQFALVGILALGAFYRLYKIERVPLEMGCDLPHIYNNVRLILRSEFPIFFPSHPGREGLFFYLAAPVCRLFGLRHTTIKLAGALVGIVTLPVVYLLGRELFDREVGIYASAFLSMSHWHMIMTRTGYRASSLPLVLAMMWYFLVRAFKTHRRWFYALAGFLFGLGFYTYNAFMVAPLMVLGLFIVAWLTEGRSFVKQWTNALSFALVALYTVIPLSRYIHDHPRSYIYRAGTRITNMEKEMPGHLLRVFLSNLRKTILMFNYRGDSVFASNIPGHRQLAFSAAMLFVLGLAYLLWHWRQWYNGTVIVALFVMLLPSSLALAFPNEVPGAIRACGALPAAMIVAGLALALMRRRLITFGEESEKDRLSLSLRLDGGGGLTREWDLARIRSWVGTGILVLALFLEVRAAYLLYFQDYVEHLPEDNRSISLEMAEAIDDFADDGESYIKIMPHWYDGNAVRAQLRIEDQSWHNELAELRPGRPPFVGKPGKFMVILHPADSPSLETLQEAFSAGVVLKHSYDNGDTAFVTFYGER
jgi:4-amino-4-deoxy-L-arabinose transferase-like glycosyltransferase